MSLRLKFIIALLATSLAAVVLVGVVAHERMISRFDEYLHARASQNFRGDVAAYWLTYGTWDDGQRIESFRHFAQRRSALLTHRDNPFGQSEGSRRVLSDTGGPAEARALDPWTDPATGLAPVELGRLNDGPTGGSSGHGTPPPFQFLLFDPDGRILNPRSEIGRAVRPEERAQGIPIEVGGRFVAFAAPIGVINYSNADRFYFGAVWEAIAWGAAAAALMAVVLGFAVGTGMSRSLRKLTDAVNGMHGGQLRQQVTIDSRDEVGALARAFNAMSNELALTHEKLHESYQTIRVQADQLREQVTRDSLTGLHNRWHFDDSAARLLALANRHKTPLSVVIADIDFFKRINDNYSHATGDAVLREVAHLFRLETRESDLVARYGGEEFVFALPQSSGLVAVECCERLRLRIEQHPWQDLAPGLKVTISMGVCDDIAAGGIEAMLQEADRQLYRAKAAGRNRVCSADWQIAAASQQVVA